MTRAAIIAKVKAKLEELTPFDEGLVVLSAGDVKPITSYVDDTLNDASDEVRMILPLHLITPDTISAAMTVGTDGVGSLVLPSDYLRLYAIKAPEWAREVHRPISTENPEYKLQRNTYTRGKAHKPVVAITRDATNQKLELYTVATATLDRKLYVKRVLAEANPDSLIPFVVLMCALKVYDIIGNVEGSKLMEKELSQMIKEQTL
jgi:hypothetical protein